MSRAVLSAASGFLLAMGLGIAGLTDPRRIVGFLDFAGDWDPSALFVMVAAAAVFAIGSLVYERALWGGSGSLPPPKSHIDRELVLGALLFGVGWGMSGLCPGPALTALAGGSRSVLVFVGTMIAGMAAHAAVAPRLGSRASRAHGRRELTWR